jgi:hypothetical protein
MVGAISIRILCQILLVIVGAEDVLATKTSELLLRWQSIGRHSVDVDVDPPVDLKRIRARNHPGSDP